MISKEIFSKIESVHERLNSGYVELKDIASEAESLAESVDLDPSRRNQERRGAEPHRIPLVHERCG